MGTSRTHIAHQASSFLSSNIVVHIAMGGACEGARERSCCGAAGEETALTGSPHSPHGSPGDLQKQPLNNGRSTVVVSVADKCALEFVDGDQKPGEWAAISEQLSEMRQRG